MKALHFKSKAGYKRFLAFTHMHKLTKKQGRKPLVFIRGRKHKVKHGS